MICRHLDQLVLWGSSAGARGRVRLEMSGAVRREGPRAGSGDAQTPRSSTQTRPGGLPRRRQFCLLGIVHVGEKLDYFWVFSSSATM